MWLALTAEVLSQSALLKSIYTGNSWIQPLGCSALTKIHSKTCTDFRHTAFPQLHQSISQFSPTPSPTFSQDTPHPTSPLWVLQCEHQHLMKRHQNIPHKVLSIPTTDQGVQEATKPAAPKLALPAFWAAKPVRPKESAEGLHGWGSGNWRF